MSPYQCMTRVGCWEGYRVTVVERFDAGASGRAGRRRRVGAVAARREPGHALALGVLTATLAISRT